MTEQVIKENNTPEENKRVKRAFSSSFIQNRACQYFPCHKTDDPDNFNCLFCYCPLYALGEKCGGNFAYSENGFKSCVNCMFPHEPENYSLLLKKMKGIFEMTRKNPEELKEYFERIKKDNNEE